MSVHRAHVAVGTPAKEFQVEEWETARIDFHGFAGLTTTKGAIVASPEFTCVGHQWRVGVYPGGSASSNDGMVGVYLYNMSARSIKLDHFAFSVKNSDGVDITNGRKRSNGPNLFDPVGNSSKDNWGIRNFARHSNLLSALVEGTLIIEVWMRCTGSSIDPHPFVGENPSRDMVLKLFMDDKTADIVFEVGEDGQQRPDSKKRSRTEPVEFHAHRLILKQSAPMLAALCPPGDGTASVPITDMAPETFRVLLFYLYGGEVSEEDYESHARDIIKAADRFEIVGLKLAAEAWYVKSTELNLDTVMEILLYSDAKNLALLKEAVMDFIVANRKDVLKKVPLNEVPGGLFADLLAAMTMEMENSTNGTVENDFSSMRVSNLRRKLHEKGLGIDGSREMLIAALEESD